VETCFRLVPASSPLRLCMHPRSLHIFHQYSKRSLCIKCFLHSTSGRVRLLNPSQQDLWKKVPMEPTAAHAAYHIICMIVFQEHSSTSDYNKKKCQGSSAYTKIIVHNVNAPGQLHTNWPMGLPGLLPRSNTCNS